MTTCETQWTADDKPVVDDQSTSADGSSSNGSYAVRIRGLTKLSKLTKWGKSKDPFQERYVLGEMLGEGKFSTVYAAKIKLSVRVRERKEPHPAVACKVLPRSDETKNHDRMIAKEVELMRVCVHARVLQMVDHVVGNVHNYVISARCYGSVEERVKGLGTFEEQMHDVEKFGADASALWSEAKPQKQSLRDSIKAMFCDALEPVSRRAAVKKWTGQLLEALAHIHALGVVHRDVKPANMLCTSPRPTTDIVLSDFGLSDFEHDIPKGQTAGSPFYWSPEVQLKLGTASRADVWAAGITAYQLVVGQYPHVPFWTSLLQEGVGSKGLTQYGPELARQLRDGRFRMDFSDTGLVKSGLGSAVKLMLEPEVASRPTASELLAVLAGTPMESKDLDTSECGATTVPSESGCSLAS